jgi:hypothetical protein
VLPNILVPAVFPAAKLNEGVAVVVKPKPAGLAAPNGCARNHK